MKAFPIVLSIIIGLIVLYIAYHFWQNYKKQSKYKPKVVYTNEDGSVVVVTQNNEGEIIREYYNRYNYSGAPDMVLRDTSWIAIEDPKVTSNNGDANVDASVVDNPIDRIIKIVTCRNCR